MKLRAILLLSLVLNVSIVGAWWFTTRPSTDSASASAKSEAKSAAQSKEKQRTTRIITEVTSDNFDWTKVESEDYKKYIANLRAIGCPEETIRDIIITDINKLYAGKIAGLYPSPKDFKFWQTRVRGNRDTQRERDQKIRDLEKEKRDLVKELLGVDLEAEMARQSGEPDQDAWRYGFLSPEKEQQVRALLEKSREAERAAFSNGDWRDPQNRAKFTAMRAQREAELAQLMTPEEFQEYELRNSRTARNMRDDLASFSPSQDEFKKIFDLKKAYDDQYAYQGGGDDAARSERDKAKQQLEEQLHAMLGDERFKQYQLAQDNTYRNLYDFMQRNNLPAKMAETLYPVRQLFDSERDNILKDQNLQPAERTALLAALSEKTKTTLSQSLGPDFAKYQAAGGGGWLDVANSGRGGNRGGKNGKNGKPGGK